jgi:UDP-hydrolysing UDP-N-acetyl-D-glucosamine 2-epimerase
MSRKICIVVNSRANYGRIKSVLEAIDSHPALELQLIVGASALLFRFGNALEIIKQDGFEPTATVYSIVEGETPTTMAKSTGLAILELATLFENIRPDIALTIADRFETMATAIAASYMNIPLAHTQGGEITGSIDESVRHAVTKLSHIHFAATQPAAQNIVRMGEDPGRVHLTGCPSIDVLMRLDLSLDEDLLHRYGGVGARIDLSKPYLVVLQHPVTTEFGEGFDQVNKTLTAIHELGMQAIWLWPNVDAGSDDVAKGLRLDREHRPDSNVHFFRHFSVEDYARLMNGAACVVGNSSSALREGSFLGVPAVNIGTRQQGRQRGLNVLDVGHDAVEIRRAIEKQIHHGRYERDQLFGDGRAGMRIAELLASEDISIQKQLTYSKASDGS